MEKVQSKGFYRRTIKVGNSAGVLLPKKLLGADVRVIILNNPQNIKKEVIKILENYLEELRGIYILSNENNIKEVLAISMSLSKSFEKGNYKINIVPLNLIKKSIKEKKVLAEKLFRSKPVLNKWLLADLKKGSEGN